MQTFIPFLEARRIVLDHVQPLASERISLAETLGRVLAEPIVSREMIPPFDNSAMDGFAVHSSDIADLPGALPIAATIAAGGGLPEPLTRGVCARIMTGAPLPEGADAVVPVELAEVSDERVRFKRAPSAGENIRRAGENVRAGERILDAGVQITPPIVGMMATLGYGTVEVSLRPRVVVVATGDELVDASETPGPSQIRDSNGPTLLGQVDFAGGLTVGTQRVGDDRGRLREALSDAAKSADVLVVSGGVSMGEFDFVRAELDAVGFEAKFWKVRQRPGKPLLFGLIGSMPVFGLPGNPVSASVCFEEYVRPALSALQGMVDPVPPLESAVLDEDVSTQTDLHHIIRGRLRREGAELHVAPTGPQGSHISRSLVLAECFIHLPAGRDRAGVGSTVQVERLPWSR